ncbi:hypothetical protein KCM76_02180 [Zooshikella marina]|uniref:DUF6920 family protein n=1 Tax=Zooshikella ganghwensis TaxID=202772 RepID=UPI001BB01908|nr:DUF6544 family protein [Zooshikella ganghwensis]MBU2704769.1 hypothetical protein [Zooshikella ganghwensis]
MLLKKPLITLLSTLLLAACVLTFFYKVTESSISHYQMQIRDIAKETSAPNFNTSKLKELPEPVQHYFNFVFREPIPVASYVEMTMEGAFRRPQTTSFSPTTAEQTAAIKEPAFVFSATTVMFPGIWARAFDAFAKGKMDMKAKILSTITVVDEKETPELNKTSLQRWLLESPLYPTALLPGGPVQWEAINEQQARAIVSSDGLQASLIATFREDGSLASFQAETDGDLNTPYHGSGEQVLRSDYRLVSGMMIPHKFSIARIANGQSFPFWKGQITSITFH